MGDPKSLSARWKCGKSKVTFKDPEVDPQPEDAVALKTAASGVQHSRRDAVIKKAIEQLQQPSDEDSGLTTIKPATQRKVTEDIEAYEHLSDNSPSNVDSEAMDSSSLSEKKESGPLKQTTKVVKRKRKHKECSDSSEGECVK